MTDIDTSDGKRHHLLIAGTGRAGTSALVRLLDACGLETVLADGGEARWFELANAGAESNPVNYASNPYVIKSPWSYQFIEQLIRDDRVIVDQVLIPIRRLATAAASRVLCELATAEDAVASLPATDPNRARIRMDEYGYTPGGTINSLEPLDQERILARSLHLLLEQLEEADVPFSFIAFPRFVDEPSYAFCKLSPFLPGVSTQIFESRFSEVISASEVRVEAELRAIAKNKQDSAWRSERATVDDLRSAAVERVLRRKESR